MRFKSFCFLFLFVYQLSGQNVWQALSNAPNFTGSFSKLDDVHFVSPNLGWTINALGEVYKTEDGGDNWQLKTNLGEFLRCVKFANENVGYIGSLMGGFGGPVSNAKIFKTIDGGDTWTDLTASISPLPIGVCGLSVVDESTVYGCGAFYGPARVYKSLDGGSSWQNFDLSAYASSLVDIHFFSADRGIIVGLGNASFPGGIILETNDGGASWEVLYNNPADNLLWKIQALDEDHLFASIAGTNLDGGAQILISDDGGDSWTSKQVPIDGTQLQGVGFISPQHGFAGGFFNGVYETKDGGDNWELIDIGANYNRFQKINDNLMYASGHTIYKYSEELSTSVEEEIFGTPNYNLYLFPNPVNDLLTIEYHLGNNTHLKLELYDAYGKIVKTYYDGWHNAGQFQINADVASLQSGIYLLAFFSREGDIMKKVIVKH